MTSVTAKSNVSEIEFRAVVTRADGTVEDLGRIAYWIYRSRWRRFTDFILRRNPNVGTITQG